METDMKKIERQLPVQVFGHETFGDDSSQEV